MEEHAATLSVLTRLLIHAGYSVTAATSVAEARALAERERFDGVIWDIGLPDAEEKGGDFWERVALEVEKQKQ